MEKLTIEVIDELLLILKNRFESNMARHREIVWIDVLEKLKGNKDKLWSLMQMEKTGGQPDVVMFDENTKEYIFYDCSKETPAERRSLCYDKEALELRKAFKPNNNAIDMAKEIDIQILSEEEYIYLQTLGKFDLKTSSWLKTVEDIRKLGGAIFGDRRYDRVFIYHNGAESYYSGRGFRGSLRI